ncbi:Glycoside hydrolase, 10 [Datura stramonium]|uniref:Glycoside hydrolase, 10 n=1 Tax=Datura stramonium TaxID=4076 RepID=A0ABS8T8B4_DATST|nr:Glycoside hydrolase, 10 [Datura stramonium]
MIFSMRMAVTPVLLLKSTLSIFLISNNTVHLLEIWFTEIDVSSDNEYIRADDLEVMLREAYAHPAVEGIMLWGFWELFMSRPNAHLVNAEGELYGAGKKYLALKH